MYIDRFKNFESLLQPAKIDGGFRMDGQWVWGGSPIYGEDGKYHLYASAWSKKFRFNPNWISNSRIVHAVSGDPEGPFEYSDEVLPPRGNDYWDGVTTHNPSICRHGGEYILFYMGTNICRHHAPTFDEPILSNDAYSEARGNQRIGIATAPSPYGPWKRYDQPILDVRRGYWDALMTTNPAPWIFDDGSVLLLYKSMPALDTPWSAYGVARAEHYLGEYRRISDRPILEPGSEISYEDAVIWQEDGLFHMLCKDRLGTICGQKGAGCYASSTDGETWNFTKGNKAYSLNLTWADGRQILQGALERPQVLRQQGRATHVFFAIADGLGGFENAENTWNISIRLDD